MRTATPKLSLNQSAVNINVFGRCVEYHYEVTYLNDHPDKAPLEARFTLPNDDGVTYTHVSATFSSNPVEELIAKIVSKQDALNTYNDAIAEGKTVARAEHTEDGKSISVLFGNVQPDESVRLRVRALTELDSSNVVSVPLGDFKGSIEVSASISVVTSDPMEALLVDSDVAVSLPPSEQGTFQLNHVWKLPRERGTQAINIEICTSSKNLAPAFYVTNFTDGPMTMTAVRFIAPTTTPTTTTTTTEERPKVEEQMT
eukprot:PhF_6_TR6068/c0_g1_i1/m.8807